MVLTEIKLRTKYTPRENSIGRSIIRNLAVNIFYEGESFKRYEQAPFLLSKETVELLTKPSSFYNAQMRYESTLAFKTENEAYFSITHRLFEATKYEGRIELDKIRRDIFTHKKELISAVQKVRDQTSTKLYDLVFLSYIESNLTSPEFIPLLSSAQGEYKNSKKMLGLWLFNKLNFVNSLSHNKTAEQIQKEILDNSKFRLKKEEKQTLELIINI